MKHDDALIEVHKPKCFRFPEFNKILMKPEREKRRAWDQKSLAESLINKIEMSLFKFKI